MTEIGVGASTCASGSHVWNGKTGTFTANAMNIPAKIHGASVAPNPPASEPRIPPLSFIDSANAVMSGIESALPAKVEPSMVRVK